MFDIVPCYLVGVTDVLDLKTKPKRNCHVDVVENLTFMHTMKQRISRAK